MFTARRFLSSVTKVNPNLHFLRQLKQKKYKQFTLDDKSRVLSICIHNTDNDNKYKDIKKQLADNGVLSTVDKYVFDHNTVLPDDSSKFLDNLPKSYDKVRNFMDYQYKSESIFGKFSLSISGYAMDTCEREIMQYLIDSKINELEKID
jgi:hypothetical protein